MPTKSAAPMVELDTLGTFYVLPEACHSHRHSTPTKELSRLEMWFTATGLQQNEYRRGSVAVEEYWHAERPDMGVAGRLSWVARTSHLTFVLAFMSASTYPIT